MSNGLPTLSFAQSYISSILDSERVDPPKGSPLLSPVALLTCTRFGHRNRARLERYSHDLGADQTRVRSSQSTIDVS